MTVLGEFEEGDLYLPRLGIRLAYHPGSVILFKSALLEHTILPFTGELSLTCGFPRCRSIY